MLKDCRGREITNKVVKVFHFYVTENQSLIHERDSAYFSSYEEGFECAKKQPNRFYPKFFLAEEFFSTFSSSFSTEIMPAEFAVHTNIAYKGIQTLNLSELPINKYRPADQTTTYEYGNGATAYEHSESWNFDCLMTKVICVQYLDLEDVLKYTKFIGDRYSYGIAQKLLQRNNFRKVHLRELPTGKRDSYGIPYKNYKEIWVHSNGVIMVLDVFMNYDLNEVQTIFCLKRTNHRDDFSLKRFHGQYSIGGDAAGANILLHLNFSRDMFDIVDDPLLVKHWEGNNKRELHLWGYCEGHSHPNDICGWLDEVYPSVLDAVTDPELNTIMGNSN